MAVTSGYTPVVVAQPGPAMSQLLDLDSRKCIEQNSIDLDMTNINSAELRSLLPSEDFSASMVDAHLSENLSSNLNIIDHPPSINKLNSKTNISASSSYMPNIPQNKNEFQGGSDSLNNLKSEIELLNQLSSAHLASWVSKCLDEVQELLNAKSSQVICIWDVEIFDSL